MVRNEPPATLGADAFPVTVLSPSRTHRRNNSSCAAPNDAVGVESFKLASFELAPDFEVIEEFKVIWRQRGRIAANAPNQLGGFREPNAGGCHIHNLEVLDCGEQRPILIEKRFEALQRFRTFVHVGKMNHRRGRR